MVSYQISEHQLLWTRFLIPILHSLFASVCPSASTLLLPTADFNSLLLGACLARRWFPGKGRSLYCIHQRKNLKVYHKVLSVASPFVNYNMIFPKTVLKVFLWSCLACIIHLSIIKDSQHNTGLLLLGILWSSFYNMCPDCMWQPSAKAIELFPRATNWVVVKLVLKDSTCSGGLPV